MLGHYSRTIQAFKKIDFFIFNINIAVNQVDAVVELKQLFMQSRAVK